METTSNPTRADVLGPYLSRLGSLAEHRDESKESSFIHVGEKKVVVEPWERTHLLGALYEPAAGEEHAWRNVLADGVAFRTRCLVDLGEIEDGGQPAGETADRLIVDIALGLCLMEETQQAVNLLVLGGKLDDAKNLTKFRHKIGRALNDLKETAGEDVSERAVELVPALAPDVAERAAKEKAAKKEKDTAQLLEEAARLEREAENARLGITDQDQAPNLAAIGATAQKIKSKVPILLTIMVVLAAAAAGVHFWLLAPSGPQIDPLTRADFTSVPELTTVTARPPSLFATMSYDSWRGMTPDMRAERVESIGRIASREGYTGALLKADSGKALAQWLQKSGVTILDHPEAAKPVATNE